MLCHRWGEGVKTPAVVSIIIVSWNVRDFLEACLRSVYRETASLPIEVIVVDNGSSDGTPEMVERDFPAVRLFRYGENLGFTRANNVALRMVLQEKTSRYILLLNSDTEIRERGIEELAAYLDKRPEVDAVAPALILPDGRFQPGAGGHFPSWTTGFNYFFFLFKLFPRKAPGLFIDQARLMRKKAPVALDWLSAACLLVRREIVERAGVLNEDYSIYADDIDWGLRMRRAGGLLHYLPRVRILHYHGVTAKHVTGEMNTKWLKMVYFYVRQEKGAVQYALFRAFSVCGFFLRFAAYAVLAGPKKEGYYPQKKRELKSFLLFSLRGDRA